MVVCVCVCLVLLACFLWELLLLAGDRQTVDGRETWKGYWLCFSNDHVDFHWDVSLM